jgi:hypothetical protein
MEKEPAPDPLLSEATTYQLIDEIADRSHACMIVYAEPDDGGSTLCYHSMVEGHATLISPMLDCLREVINECQANQ